MTVGAGVINGQWRRQHSSDISGRRIKLQRLEPKGLKVGEAHEYLHDIGIVSIQRSIDNSGDLYSVIPYTVFVCCFS
ncbi:hypothetical protein VNO78_14813 [Psophocarpus tetragonolobus]|uniref:Uncharacterized protein n=1 Tax=Psophocarpus tetragonolobus TaxID=3891 RepID=A0AAN9SDH8_PSOTE